MKYLKKFETHPEYTEFIETDEFIKPNVSCCTNETLFSKDKDVHYNPYADFEYDNPELEYLTFEAVESGSFSFTLNTINYSLDDGNTWTSLQPNTSTPIISEGHKILWKASGLTPSSGTGSSDNNAKTGGGIGTFSSTGKFNVCGNIMSLVYGDNFTNNTSLSSYQFMNLFNECTKLVKANNLALPSMTMVSCCYKQMFKHCTSLKCAPTLPATSMHDYSYQYMFDGCTSLTTAPELPATALRGHCYDGMLQNCTSLTTAPDLNCMTLAGACYMAMFSGCTSLINAPKLPSTSLQSYCYYAMFHGCTSLETAPVLPAKTLTDYAYYRMFKHCTKLNYIKALFTTTPSSTNTYEWVDNVASTGTFVKNSAATWTTTGVNGVPIGWTVQTASN